MLLCWQRSYSQSYGFPSSHVWMWELDCEESWAQKNRYLWTVVLEKALESPWTARRSNQSILKEISTEYSLKGLMLKLKLQYFGHLLPRADSLEKTLMLGKTEGGRTEGGDRRRGGWIASWLNGHEFESSPGVGDGQGGLACCSPWGGKESDMTEWLNWTVSQK